MRKLAFLSFITFLLASCSNDPVAEKKKDSIDSVNKTLIAVDTFHVDSGNVTNTYYDCSVLTRRIPADTEQQKIRNDLAQLVHCGIDSFDFLYIVPNLFPGYVSENQVSGKKVTYGDFVAHVNEFKATEAYTQLHVRVETLDSLRHTPFDAQRIYAMKPTLGKLGFTEPEWEMFSGFAKTFPVPTTKKVFTWGDLLDEFDKYRPN